MSDLSTDLQAARERMNSLANDLTRDGFELARAENAYQVSKAKRVLEMKSSGTPATLITQCLKGDSVVAPLLLARDCAKVTYDTTQEALNVAKLEARLIESEYDRLYRG